MVSPVRDFVRYHFEMVVPFLVALLEEFSELSLFLIYRAFHHLYSTFDTKN